ncbi:MAG TPA: DEAD/DEAH box helicase [Candidatus Deferrimicrobium sp.]|nr:DEAD/DEAH box helicase [Candidatus Deferrimicrobium sp.]
MKFTDIKLSEKVLKGLQKAGFTETTDIQEKVLTPLLNGRCIIGQAKTGSGKTLAFGIPIIERIDENKGEIQAVIITPTRELAKQVSEEISKVAKFTRIRTVTVYGGVSFQRQVDLINRGVQIVVATPGRLIDHLKRGLKINPKIIILDEADKMFDMGFYEDVNYILKLIKGQTPQQFGFFGATIPDRTVSLAKRYMQNPVIITTREKGDEKIPSSIEQFYYILAETSDKLNALINILNQLEQKHNGDEKPLKILVFVKTRVGTRRLTETLNQMGFPANYISSDLRQMAREQALEEFERNGMLLVATDVLSRGIDIENVTHVINYDKPEDVDDYLHRIGRTGRMGKDGVAITFIMPEEEFLITRIEEQYGTIISKRYLNNRTRGAYNF